MDKEFKVIKEEIISEGWGTLKSVTYEIKHSNGKTNQHKQEIYQVANGATILLYNKQQKTVILNRQFRLVTTFNNNPSGMMIEAAAGVIDKGFTAEETVIKEALEETGYVISDVRPVMQLYVSPGTFTEMIYFYVGAYDPSDKREDGGGKEEEGEDIHANEVPFSLAIDMMERGEIKDAKTVILLQYVKLHGLLD